MQSRAASNHSVISTALADWDGGMGDFVAWLNEQKLSFLSYSKLQTLSFCEYRYYLEYVEGVVPDVSMALVKGRVFHEVAALLYGQLEEDGWDLEGVDLLIAEELGEGDGRHVRNAVELLLENVPSGYELVAIEEPFALDLGDDLPPLLGVIDLILRKGSTYLVIDHKTGKKLYDQDRLQLLLYREHVRRAYEPARCSLAFDEYRWVNNLSRIRVPAFRRTRVSRGSRSWPGVLQRIRRAYKRMVRIEEKGDADADGPCYMCLVADDCPERSRHSWY